MSEPMPTIPTQSPFTYPIPNSSASPSVTQDDTFMPNPSASPSFTQDDTFMPEPIQPMPTFTQTAFSQPAVHTQHTHPAQTNPTGQQYPNNVQSQQFQQFQTATISANNAKFPYLEKEKYEIWAMKMEYWIQNADHNLWRIVQQGNSPKRLGKDAKGNTIIHPPVSLDEHVAVQRENKVRTLLLQALPEDHMPDFHHYDDARDIWMAVKARFGYMTFGLNVQIEDHSVGSSVVTNDMNEFQNCVDECEIADLKSSGFFIHDELNNIFTKTLNTDEDERMVIEVSNKEIKDAIFDIGDNKAPGPDGFTSTFFKRAWNIVKDDVANLIKVTEFRPILCCNVLYKCFSKILTKRMKPGLDKLVNVNQSAFILGRLIQDNILITQELLRGYNRKNRHKRCAMKIDVQKAYDTLNWEFLKKALISFGFHSQMMQWIMTCVSSYACSVCINGDMHGYFKGGKGLRQGDHVSPYLFTLVMAVFSLIMQKNVLDNHKFKFHYGCKDM
ncbi:RNA-directed DNA polymerase, eukaryota, reverse transcriptase zinc-binding domain protein [Tanacetum coccineum]